MRKILCLLMLSILLLILAACGKDEISEDPAIEAQNHVHSFGEWTVKTPSSCTEQGTEERICACGVAENRLIDPVGHSFEDWEIVTPANCVAGIMKRVCRNCPHTESAPTESIHPLGEGQIIVQPSCYQTGYIVYRCTVCVYFEQREIPKTHEFSEWEESFPATCVASGGIKRSCSKCGKNEIDYTDPLGHDEYNWTRVENRSNSVVLVEHKGCRRCDIADDERTGFVKNTFSADETVLTITNPYSPANPAFNYTQFIERAAGSCYSKKGYYQAYLSDDGGLAVLVLLNTNNKIVCSDVRTDLGYADDITYNSKTNQLLVLNEKRVVIFDGDTLAYVRTVNIPRTGDAIAYVESTDRYAIMVDDRVEYYNAQFGYVCCFHIFDFGNGPYQICADDNYVYVMFVANDGTNRNVHVYLHNGIALGKVAIQKTSNSNPTGISIVDGYLYVSIPDGSLRTLLKKLE